MVTSWQVIESGALSAQAIMAKDTLLLEQLHPDSSPLLHLYEWNSPCLTYGYFTDPTHHLDLEALESHELQMARRPTGGGIIFHLSDLAFSILLPAHHPHFSLNTLANYAWINQKVVEVIKYFTQQALQPSLLAIESCGSNQDCQAFCMAKPTQYDLIIAGKKVGGAAQRRTKCGLLHQGTLSLLFPPINLLNKILRNHEIVLAAMQKHTYCVLSAQATAQDLQEARSQIKKLLQQVLMLT